MASSGIRLGAWDYLRWGNIRPIERDGEIVAAKMIVYAEEEAEPEAWRTVKKWIDYRETSGEQINDDSCIHWPGLSPSLHSYSKRTEIRFPAP